MDVFGTVGKHTKKTDEKLLKALKEKKRKYNTI